MPPRAKKTVAFETAGTATADLLEAAIDLSGLTTTAGTAAAAKPVPEPEPVADKLEHVSEEEEGSEEEGSEEEEEEEEGSEGEEQEGFDDGLFGPLQNIFSDVFLTPDGDSITEVLASISEGIATHNKILYRISQVLEKRFASK